MNDRDTAARLRRRCQELGADVGQSAPRGFEVPWERVEASLETPLPLSYKIFIEHFGPGRFAEEFHYYTPGIESAVYELEYCVRGEYTRSLEPGPEGDLSYGIFPEPGGLLLFGDLPEDALYWDTSSGGPDEWPIVIPSFDDWLLRYEGDIIAFVADLLTEAPAIGDVEYDPVMLREFVPNDGRRINRNFPALEVYSAFRDA